MKKKPVHSQEQADETDGALGQLGQFGRQLGQVSGAGGPKDIAQAEEHEAGRDRADEQVLDARLHVDAVPPAQGHQDVEGIGGELQGHVNGEEFHRRDQQHHADNGGGEKQVKFGLLALLDVGQVMGDRQDQEEAQGQGELEDLAEQVNPVGFIEKITMLKEAASGEEHPHPGQNQGDPVIGLDLGRPPEAKAEKDQGQAQVIEFRSEQRHIHGHIPWRKGIIAVLISAHHQLREKPEK